MKVWTSILNHVHEIMWMWYLPTILNYFNSKVLIHSGRLFLKKQILASETNFSVSIRRQPPIMSILVFMTSNFVFVPKLIMLSEIYSDSTLDGICLCHMKLLFYLLAVLHFYSWCDIGFHALCFRVLAPLKELKPYYQILFVP